MLDNEKGNLQKSKQVKYPIYYEDYRICLHCGSNNVVPINNFGKEEKLIIYPISYMICKSCNTRYKVNWVKNSKGEMIPTCCGEDVIYSIGEYIQHLAEERRRKL